jgi:hypothetical protein
LPFLANKTSGCAFEKKFSKVQPLVSVVFGGQARKPVAPYLVINKFYHTPTPFY